MNKILAIFCVCAISLPAHAALTMQVVPVTEPAKDPTLDPDAKIAAEPTDPKADAKKEKNPANATDWKKKLENEGKDKDAKNAMPSLPTSPGGSGLAKPNPEGGYETEYRDTNFGVEPAQTLEPQVPWDQMPFSGAGAPAAGIGDSLSCIRNGAESCAGVSMGLAPKPPKYFNNLPNGKRQEEFIKWILPSALYIQAVTGLPASVLITQAAHETGWGTSHNFNSEQNLFGHSCWKKDQTQNFTVGDKKVLKATGVCNKDRPAEEGGMYLKFATREEAMIAYAANILNSKHYPNARRAVYSARQMSPPQTANSLSVLTKIANGGYATDKAYLEVTGSILQSGKWDLQQYDRDPCALCVAQQGIGSGTAPTTTPAPGAKGGNTSPAEKTE